MLIGGAVREASVLGYHVVPLFSYYSFHGPVFRVMLQVRRGKLPKNRHYGFISYCTQCGNSREVSWTELGQILCTCSNVPGSLVVSGPLWTGPLHCATFLAEIRDLAEKWGWISNGTGKNLETLIKLMIDESDPLLQFGYIKLQEATSRAKANSPRLDTLLSTLHKVHGLLIFLLQSFPLNFLRLVFLLLPKFKCHSTFDSFGCYFFVLIFYIF